MLWQYDPRSALPCFRKLQVSKSLVFDLVKCLCDVYKLQRVHALLETSCLNRIVRRAEFPILIKLSLRRLSK